jgi:hypothetical protein
MATALRFSDLAVGERFYFSNEPHKVCVKTGAREFEVEADRAPGRVGIGDNPVGRR